jgi:hypothetical protein
LAGLVRQHHHADQLPADAEGPPSGSGTGPHFDAPAGRHGGAARAGSLNFATGRLDPSSYAAIARKANVCERTVATALARLLRKLGILHWVRRCTESWRDGRFVLDAGRSHESRAILATCSNLGKSY